MGDRCWAIQRGLQPSYRHRQIGSSFPLAPGHGMQPFLQTAISCTSSVNCSLPSLSSRIVTSPEALFGRFRPCPWATRAATMPPKSPFILTGSGYLHPIAATTPSLFLPSIRKREPLHQQGTTQRAARNRVTLPLTPPANSFWPKTRTPTPL